MTGPENLPSLDDLQRKINEANSQAGMKNEGEPKAEEPQNAGAAMQVGIELVAGVAVGSFVGFYLDRWLGTTPWFFIVCFFLGAAAGFRNLVRQARKDTHMEIK